MDEDISVDDATLRRMCHLFSHDLRNPLAAIVTNLEFAKRMLDDVDEDLAEAVTDSVIACEVLRRIVANFDLISSTDPDKASLHEVVVEDLVRDVVDKCADQAEQAELTVKATGLEGRTPVRVDRGRLHLAIENAVANSLQHAPAGSQVDVSIAIDGKQVMFAVEDDGKPVEERLRAGASTPEMHTMSTREPGMRYSRGLGLLVTRLASQSQGGKLEITERGGRHRLVLTLASL